MSPYRAAATGLFLTALFLKARVMFDWRDFLAKQQTPGPTPDHHYELELDPHEMRALSLSLTGRDSGLTGEQTVTLKERLKDARRVEGPRLPDAKLDWDELEATAALQGCSAADVIYDRAKGKDQ